MMVELIKCIDQFHHDPIMVELIKCIDPYEGEANLGVWRPYKWDIASIDTWVLVVVYVYQKSLYIQGWKC